MTEPVRFTPIATVQQTFRELQSAGVPGSSPQWARPIGRPASGRQFMSKRKRRGRPCITRHVLWFRCLRTRSRIASRRFYYHQGTYYDVVGPGRRLGPVRRIFAAQHEPMCRDPRRSARVMRPSKNGKSSCATRKPEPRKRVRSTACKLPDATPLFVAIMTDQMCIGRLQKSHDARKRRAQRPPNLFTTHPQK
jgi:hypothetical protein